VADASTRQPEPPPPLTLAAREARARLAREGGFALMPDVSERLDEFSPWIREVQTIVIPVPEDPTGKAGGWVRQTNGVLRPEWFGARSRAGEERDDSDALEAMFAALDADNRTVQIDADHVISRRIEIAGKHGFRVAGSGSIRAADTMPVLSGFQCLFVVDCTDFRIDGISIYGNRERRKPAEVPAHLLELRSCSGFQISNVTVSGAVTDCLYIACGSDEVGNAARHAHDGVFTDCAFEDAFRQGASIIQGRNLRFVRCRFARSHGTAPAAGIDLESNDRDIDGAIHDVGFEDCTFDGSEGYGLLVASAKTPRNITLRGCTFRDNRAGAIGWYGSGGSAEDCVFDGFDGSVAKRGCIDVGANPSAGGLDIVRPAFARLAGQDEGHPLIYVHRVSAGHVRLIDAADTRARYIANFRGASCALSGGRFDGAEAGAVGLYGPSCVVEGTTFDRYGGDAVRILADDCRVSSCHFLNPARDTPNGAIRAIKGRRIAIEGNDFRRAQGQAGPAVVLHPGMDATVSGNRFAGFAADAVRYTP
jgi:hypothetical protein